MKKIFFLLLFILIIPIVNSIEDNVIVYENSACGHCDMYLMELKVFLKDNGIKEIIEKDVINNLEDRSALDRFNRLENIPIEMQGHMTTIVNTNLILEGHIPIDMLNELFIKYPNHDFPKLIVYQDSMESKDKLRAYKVMSNDKINECDIKTGIEECVNGKGDVKNTRELPLLLLIIFNGAIAGLHPCTISVLLFFIAFLFTIHKTRANIFKVGLAYIVGIFIAYLFIGLGLFKAVSISSTPHLSAKIGAILILILGIINIINYFKKEKLRFTLGIPHASKETVVKLISKSSVPAAFILGLIVGICSFGCTAGIYLSILSLLLLKTTYVKGFSYLIVYNFMFILPLIIILLITSNKRVVKRMENFESIEKRYIKLIAGIVMVLTAILIWFITH